LYDTIVFLFLFLPNSISIFRFFTTLLFTVLNSLVPANAAQCSEYFYLLYRLLAFTSSSSIPLNTAEILLNTEIQWLKKVKETVRKTGVTGYHDNLLEGHLCVCRVSLKFKP
jgi:ubiquitin carboxyl-terminal hydrolase 9/24